jgi:tetratricopeptide (TPR) repeat protein
MTARIQIQRLAKGFALFAVCACVARGGEPAPDALAKGVAQFTSAYEMWEKDRFLAASETFSKISDAEPTNAQALYWKGAAEFHLVLRLRHSTDCEEQLRARAALQNTVAVLERAVTLNPKDAESHAILATAYGMMISENPNRAMELGPRVMRHRKLALQHAPENPRAHYLAGVSAFQMRVGKSNSATALESLLKAEKFFEAEAQQPRPPTAPRWGRGSCLAFIGRIYESQGKVAESKSYFEKALKLNPNDGSAIEGLKRLEAAGKNSTAEAQRAQRNCQRPSPKRWWRGRHARLPTKSTGGMPAPPLMR